MTEESSSNLPVDPVCKMTVDPDNPPGGIFDHEGTRYYFCNPQCNERFRNTPEEFLRPSSAIPAGEEGHSIDPVCSMTVDEAAPNGGTSDYLGERYYFCNLRCNEKFTDDPEGILTSYRESLDETKPEQIVELAKPKSSVFDIGGMSCAACAGTIERALRKVDGVSEANVNFAASKAYVKGFDEERVHIALW